FRDGGFYDGQKSGKILVYDSGCYTAHQELTNHVYTVLSDPGEDIYHGTLVAGVISGDYVRYIKGGEVSGIVPRSQFVFRKWDQNGLNLVDALNLGMKIGNHSVYEINPQTGHPIYVYTQGARLYDQYASDDHDILSVLVSGDDGGIGMVS